MLINSKSLPLYILFILINSENSVTQGPHHVAHTLINLNLSVWFFIKSAIPATLMVSNFTGSLAHSAVALSIQVLFSAHFIEQPKTFVVVTGTSLLFNNASMALRASKLCGVLCGFSMSSIRPW